MDSFEIMWYNEKLREKNASYNKTEPKREILLEVARNRSEIVQALRKLPDKSK
ncbi:MAG: hypothetical protein ABIJ47_13065 [Candidatus Bathyarchaeota archaeon]